ncbi:MAG: LCP family protein [Treponema sp.]|jgi:anionic cell wall polymer biosynthesis LytR-Cps2A-Psr (LCP) family protein|nr:LCP family protein [Treponema sp.]
MSEPGRRKQARRDASILFLTLIILAVGAGILFIINILQQNPIEEAFSGDRVIKILFVLEHEGKPLETCVLMYYPATRRATVFEVPGNLGRIIQTINRVDRIDTLYEPENIGNFQGEIEKLLEAGIDFFLVFGLDNLGKVVDLLEGIELFIPSRVAVYDRGNPIFFSSGVTRLDGDKTRSYLTYQLADEEEESAVFRRQRFFLGFVKRLGEQSEALKNPSLARLFQSFIRTDMDGRTQGRFFDELAGLDADRISIQAVGGNTREVSGQTLLFPYYDGNLIKEIVREAQGTLTRPVEGSLTDRVFTVEILNGSGVNGLAGRTGELLRSFGYDIISVGNANSHDYNQTLILDRSGQANAVKIFADIIHCENIQTEAPDAEISGLEATIQSYEYRSDFTLIIGKDFDGRYVSP